MRIEESASQIDRDPGDVYGKRNGRGSGDVPLFLETERGEESPAEGSPGANQPGEESGQAAADDRMARGGLECKPRLCQRSDGEKQQEYP